MSKPNNIGEYLRSKLRGKNISNQAAGSSIGLSESAFEKILTQHDIYSSRLVKLSEVVEENLFEYYNDIEPIKSYHLQRNQEQEFKIDSLNKQVKLQNEIIVSKNEIIELQRKVITEFEKKTKSSS